jgi:hypothetical protein
LLGKAGLVKESFYKAKIGIVGGGIKRDVAI